MRGIRPEGICPKCGKTFKYNVRKGFICTVHLTKPSRYSVEIYYNGERIKRGTTLEGKTLRTLADAHALRVQADNEKEAKRFDVERWKSKRKIDYQFNVLIWKWYQEKADLMERGERAPGYVPKLKTYIGYYEAFYRDKDVREVFNCKDFINKLPKISPHYRKNIVDALKSFFRWLVEERYTREIPKFVKIDVPEHEPITISKDAQLRILEFVPEEHKPIFTFLFNQGCRPGEIRALKWDCIDEDVVTYKRTFSAGKLVERTKTKNIRYNLIFPETMQIMPQKGLPNTFVFTHGKIKNHYSESYLNKIFNKALKSFNERYETDLSIELYEATKHSWGTQKVNEGVSIDLLQEWFGHSKPDMTKKYAKIKVVDAFRKMEKVIPLRTKQNKASTSDPT